MGNIETKYTNALIKESSPYLLQHAHNPVNWLPWSNEALEKAEDENKLVLISIGYAACHWCHVMEHESFENEAIAQIMNENFVCIKVDREERPDIDQIYMNAVQLLTGQGGWPLNCFALPDGRPIFGGTYFRPEQWTQILKHLYHTFKTDANRVLQAANEITNGVKYHELISVKSEKANYSKNKIENAIKHWEPYFDKEWGSNKGTPKFPMPISLELLLQHSYYFKNQTSEIHFYNTLTKIAQGGIYDHVGGGFSRYSVDEKWQIPHFEKMLYDNGQLVSLYCKAIKHKHTTLFEKTIKQTLQFIENEMTNSEGAFYSSYDADSEGVEGKFYVWSKKELHTILEEEANWFCEYFNVTENGNWEQTNILWVTETELVLKKYNLTIRDLEKKLTEVLPKLVKQRKERIAPGLDDKTLTSWNCLMSMGFIDAYEAFGNKPYIDTAIKNAKFIENNMFSPIKTLLRNYKNGVSKITAFLDDYALLIQLFVKIYENTFDYNWLIKAEKLTGYTIQNFQDPNSGMFFYTNISGNDLIAQKMELSDNVIPASNSIMANNLFTLGILLNNTDWSEISEQMMANMIQRTEANIAYYANWGILLNRYTQVQYEVIFVGEKALELKAEFTKQYNPNTIIAGSQEPNNNVALFKNRWVENETLIYVCQNNTCKLPVKTVSEALLLIG